MCSEKSKKRSKSVSVLIRRKQLDRNLEIMIKKMEMIKAREVLQQQKLQRRTVKRPSQKSKFNLPMKRLLSLIVPIRV